MEAFFGKGGRRRFQGCQRARRRPGDGRWRFLGYHYRELSVLQRAQATDGEMVIIVLGKVIDKPPLQVYCRRIMTRQGAHRVL